MERIFTQEFLLTPSESDAQRQLPLTLLVSQVIELATAHANHLDIGFLRLDPAGLGWVLSRLTVEMKRWPRVGETYRISTWVETWNRHFSERCFTVEDSAGNILGYVRTVWVIISLESHKSAGTAELDFSPDLIPDRECPILRQSRHTHFEPQKTVEYRFKYTDIDFYRHVNTVRYVALLLNQFPLEVYDTNLLSRFEIAFMREAKYGQVAVINSIEETTPTPEFVDPDPSAFSKTHTFEVKVEDNPILRSRITFTPQNL